VGGQRLASDFARQDRAHRTSLWTLVPTRHSSQRCSRNQSRTAIRCCPSVACECRLATNCSRLSRFSAGHRLGLGAGETAVLSWVLEHPDHEAIIDDRAARKCAEVNGITCRGTLGVVLAARRRNLIPAAKPLCDDLIQAGLLIDPALVREALVLVGE